MIGPGQFSFLYNRVSILANAPAASGVYALYNPQSWIYVGEGKDIRARLLDHLNGDSACLTQVNPTGFQFELCPADRRVARQDELIVALSPACNQRLG